MRSDLSELKIGDEVLESRVHRWMRRANRKHHAIQSKKERHAQKFMHEAQKAEPYRRERAQIWMEVE